jgi:AraC-like DNA-binding protein
MACARVARSGRARQSGSVQWLSRFIEDVRVLAPAGQTLVVDQLPSGRTSLVIRQIEREGDAWVFGPRTRALLKTAAGHARAIIVRFRPGWSLPVLGVAASTLTDRMIPLEHIWADRGSCTELVAARSVDEVRARLAHVIASRDVAEPSTAHLARRSIRRFEAGEAGVGHVAKELGVTARHLHRAFVHHVGTGPKEFVRAIRLQRALRQQASSDDWSRIAIDAGYYDQAHLIGDFRDLVGLTPAAYARRTRAPARAA